MDNLEKVEKLVEKTGVDYAKAKEALEASEWDLLDAVIYLENLGIPVKKSGSTQSQAQNTIPSQAQTAADTSAQAQSSTPSQAQTAADTSAQAKTIVAAPQFSDNSKSQTKGGFKKSKKCGGRVKNFLVNNKLGIYNPKGFEVVKLPVWVGILFFVFTFWITTIVILLSFAFGYKYVLEGPDLGKEGINKAVDAVRDTTYTIVNDIKEKCEEHKNENKSGNSEE